MANTAVGIGISSGPKEDSLNITHVLSCSEFEQLFDLCLCYLEVGSKSIGEFIVDIEIICPFAYIKRFFFKVF